MARLFATLPARRALQLGEANRTFGGSVIRCSPRPIRLGADLFSVLGGSMGAGLLTTGLQSSWLAVSLSRGLTPSSAFVDAPLRPCSTGRKAARLWGITRKFVHGVVEIRSFKLRPWRSYSPRFRLATASPSIGGQGVGASKRRAFRLSDYEQEQA